jgi:hypothetical protein
VASLAPHATTAGSAASYRLLCAVRQGQPLDQLPAKLAMTPTHHLQPIEIIRERFRDPAPAGPVANGHNRIAGLE